MIVLQGMLLGVAIAAPVGPISLLCMQRGLAGGFGTGARFGLGIALADGLFAVAGALGATALATLFGTLQPWLQRLAAVYLGYLAWRTWHAAQTTAPAQAATPGGYREIATGFSLTLANPLTIVSFATLFVGLPPSASSLSGQLTLAAGLFLGSLLWWLALAGLCGSLRQTLKPRWRRSIDLLAALGLAGLGLFVLLRSL
ncbi:LysE family translocator [Pseudomonas sp. EpS/L25]|uniref:LysE family translocator n=1 Tax=Pseudomonas sp. EpS/L25 TaxID=1749078 RepID=UPI00080294C2|nr:LysE family transporter [Pseudomonas sp. EpS/L25]